MLKPAYVQETLWSFATRAAFHTKNRCIHSSHDKLQFEKFFGKPQNLNHLKVFGCLSKVFALVEKKKLKLKFDSRAEEGVLLGYNSNSKTYLMDSFEKYFLETLQTRNVKLIESVFTRLESFICKVLPTTKTLFSR